MRIENFRIGFECLNRYSDRGSYCVKLIRKCSVYLEIIGWEVQRSQGALYLLL